MRATLDCTFARLLVDKARCCDRCCCARCCLLTDGSSECLDFELIRGLRTANIEAYTSVSAQVRRQRVERGPAEPESQDTPAATAIRAHMQPSSRQLPLHTLCIAVCVHSYYASNALSWASRDIASCRVCSCPLPVGASGVVRRRGQEEERSYSAIKQRQCVSSPCAPRRRGRQRRPERTMAAETVSALRHKFETRGGQERRGEERRGAIDSRETALSSHTGLAAGLLCARGQQSQTERPRGDASSPCRRTAIAVRLCKRSTTTSKSSRAS